MIIKSCISKQVWKLVILKSSHNLRFLFVLQLSHSLLILSTISHNFYPLYLTYGTPLPLPIISIVFQNFHCANNDDIHNNNIVADKCVVSFFDIICNTYS